VERPKAKVEPLLTEVTVETPKPSTPDPKPELKQVRGEKSEGEEALKKALSQIRDLEADSEALKTQVRDFQAESEALKAIGEGTTRA